MPNRAVIMTAVALTSALTLASCGKKIGDSCQTASDCDPSGTRICDLSRCGLRAFATRAVPVGTAATVRRGSLSLAGKVVWSQGRQFGMRFDGAIRATDLFVQVSQSRSAATARG